MNQPHQPAASGPSPFPGEAATGGSSAAGETAIRSGSPFAAEPAARPSSGGADFDAGVAAETARGGVLAAWLLVPLAAATAWGFPFGGVMIAGLGTVMGLVGCGSPRPRWGAAAMLIHLTLLIIALMA